MSRRLSTLEPAVEWDEGVAQALIGFAALAGGVRRLATLATFADTPFVLVTFPTAGFSFADLGGAGRRLGLELSVVTDSFTLDGLSFASLVQVGLVCRSPGSRSRLRFPACGKSARVRIPSADSSVWAAALGSGLEPVGLDSLSSVACSAVDWGPRSRLYADTFGLRVTGASSSDRSCTRWALGKRGT